MKLLQTNDPVMYRLATTRLTLQKFVPRIELNGKGERRKKILVMMEKARKTPLNWSAQISEFTGPSLGM
jgi:hypothetical protein